MASSGFPILTLLLLSLASLSVSVSVSERCHPNDKNALLQFKNDLHDPRALTWDPKTDCCSWPFLKCDNATNRIAEIFLADAGVQFHLPIPASIGDLTFLRCLSFHSCYFTGEIPQAIAKLSHLDLIDFTRNLLTGPVPAFLGNLKKLTYINLIINNLSGPIPASLSRLPLLRVLLLEQNKLTGSLPASFGDLKAKDLVIDLSDNLLTGRIPASLGRPDWYVVDLARNRLEGDISFLFGKKKRLHTAYLSSNLFKFDFSKVEIPSTLTTLEAEHNRIYGRLPAGLAEVGLSLLNVSYNSLCGRIPVGGNMQTFDATAYSNNRCLCGSPLPECK